jgi:lipopolysaccharide export system protein LptA
MSALPHPALAVLLACWLVGFASTALAAAPRNDIAVAPFEEQSSSKEGSTADAEALDGPARVDLSLLLARDLARFAPGRVVQPGDSSLPARARPEASEVRGWASKVGVDTIVVGEIRSQTSSDGGVRGIEALLETRSGHSGAAIERYEFVVEPTRDFEARLAAEVERVARKIAEDLGGAPLPSVAARPSMTVTPEEGGEDSPFEVFNSKEPIEIESDELEVVSESKSRRLIFTGNVRVSQGEVRLHTAFLEATYPKGASQPDRLDARGSVRVLEGDREVRCIEATYLREEGVVYCRGEAILVQGCDEVRGHEIEFDLDRERVRVIGAASVVIHPDSEEKRSCEDQSG